MSKHCRLKALLALILCLACLLPLLASCKRAPGNGESSSDNTEAEQNIYKDYTVIIPSSASDELRRESELLTKLIRTYTGEPILIFEDNYHDRADGAKEILIGNTNRSAGSSLELPPSGYAIKMDTDGTILIGGSTDAIVCDAVAYYIHNILYRSAVSGTQIMKEGFFFSSTYESVTLNPDYTIVYSAALDDEVNLTGYANEGIDYEVSLAKSLAEQLGEKGISVKVTSDKSEPSEKEILIGETNRAESAEFLETVGFAQFGVGCTNGKITVGGHSTATTVKACEMLGQMLGGSASLLLCKARARSNTDWTLDFPVYEGGTVAGVSESHYDGIILYITGTDKDGYDRYCRKLENLGYENTMFNEIDANVFASYETNKISIYVYFIPSENAVRLIVADNSDVEFPESVYDPYYKVADPSITQIQLDFTTNTGGMGYIVTLCDGSFVIIDSGSRNEGNADHVRIWNLLNKLNKRSDGKIIIRNWFITHCHADHILVFEEFCKAYGSKVTIEKYCECVVPESVCYNAKNPSYHVIKGFVEKANESVTNGFDMIMLHTGMKFSMYGVDFEILYTIEDLYPQRLRYFNNSSTVIRISTGTGSVLITGDIYTEASNILVSRYPTALKSDIVQISHHGNQGATKAFYDAVAPEVALWPTSETLFSRLTSGQGRSSYEIIDCYVYSEMNITEHYTNSDYSVELSIPYTPGSAKKHYISTTDQYK